MNYIYWLIVFVWTPLLVLWIINYKYLIRYKKVFLWCIFWSMVFSIPWDLVAVKTNIWFFPSDTHLNVSIFGLPLEEYFFIIFITLYLSTGTLLMKKRMERKEAL